MKTRTPLFQHLKGGKFHSAIASTFGVDFAAWENVALPSLHSSGCRNVMLLADAGMMTHAMNGASVLPQKAGRSYTASSISAPRVFHPKLTLLVGRDTARLVVASANLTSPGLAGNLEIAGVINANPELPGETQIVAGALRFLRSHLVSHGDVVGHQLELLDKRAGWLIRSERAAGPVQLSDGSAAQLLCSDDDEGIATRFARNVDTERVKRLIVVSPYWDSDLAALRSLIRVLKPEQTVLLVDVTRRLFPTHAFARLHNVSVVDISAETHSSFVHAKLFLAETDEADHVIYGSPNCTVAALGTAEMRGLNEEACLYRRLPRESVVAELELTEVLAGAPVPIEELPTQDLRGGKLEFESLAAAKSGVFEVKGDILHWHTSGRSVPAQTAVELFDVARGISAAKLEPLGELTDAVRRFRVVGELPAFARLRFPDGTCSALTCVTVAQEIYAFAREVRGKDAEKAVDRLTGSNEVGVFMLEALQALALAEDESGAGHSGATGSGKRAPDEPTTTIEEKSYKILTYEAFVSGSKARTGATVVAPGVFAGGGLWHIQQLLNRSIGMATRRSESTDRDTEERDIRRLFRRGDETANPEEQEANTGLPNSSQPDKDDDELDPRREAEERERYAAETLESVHRHVEYLWALKKKQEASTVDVLRLRVVLMVIASASTGKALTDMHAEHEANPKSRLVLPIAGDNCWPRLMLTQLGLFFGTNVPLIRSLRIVSRDTDMPSDILECWATNVWALHASQIAVRRHGEREDMRDLGVRLRVLPQQVYHGLGLDVEQFRSDSFVRTYGCLVNHYAYQLDTDPAEMWALHESWLKR